MMWHEQYSDYLPLPEVYSFVMTQLDEEKYEKDQQAKVKKMRDEVIGNSWMKSTPDLYWDVGVLIELDIKPHEWRDPFIWNQVDRAKWRAYKFVESMSQTVQRYNDHSQKQREKIRDNAGKKP